MNAAAKFRPWRQLPADVRARLRAVQIDRERGPEYRLVREALAEANEFYARRRQDRARIVAGIAALRRKEHAA